jgi:phosphate transport system substrate-binding protein
MTTSVRWHVKVPAAALGLVMLVAALVFPLSESAAFATSTEPIDGGGSTWVALAIQQWQADVARQGLTVNFQSVGSTAGRDGYINGTYLFAASEIPFQPIYCSNPALPPNNPNNSCTDEQSEAAARPYLYLPDVAGGTSLLYNLQVDGQRVTNLRLDPTTLTRIFTGVINNWDNPEIAADNPGLHLPNLHITPVVRSDGSGTSYQFTAFMAYKDAADWTNYCHSQGYPGNPCPPTSQYPAGSGFVAVYGSDGIANYVSQPYNNGSIGYAEAAYGKAYAVPLVSLRNQSGQYVQPTAVNVAVALTKAIINSDHTQNLYGVYTNPDPRAYPMSSYSYMIVPTTLTRPFTDDAQGATLSRFILYYLCQGQQEAAPLGYSPLPPNLVQLGFSVNDAIPGHATPPPLDQCNDPTITDNFLGSNGIGTPQVNVVGIKNGTNPSGAGDSSTSARRQASANRASGSRDKSTSGGTLPGGGRTSQAGTVLAVASPKSVDFGHQFRTESTGLAILLTAALVGVVAAPPLIMGRRRRPPAEEDLPSFVDLR